jgi:hypothetical protein
MKLKITFGLVWFAVLAANAQVVFEENGVIDASLYVSSAFGVAPADLDGDGDKDVVVPSYFGNRLVWLENLNGSATEVTVHVISTTIQTPWGVAAADLDADGDLDIVATSLSGNTLTWYKNTDGNGTFVLQQATYAFQANQVIVADMDNDNDPDLLWASSADGTIKWIRNTDGLGTFGTTFNIETSASSVTSIFPADIDGDGDLDVLSTYSINSSQGVAWYKNNGLSGFGTRTLLTNAFDFATSVYAGDLDGDGDMDVATASGGDNKIAWYENLTGTDAFGPQQVLTTSAVSAQVVRIVDVDGDNDKDIVFGSNTDRKLGWFENTNGNGTFGPETLIGNNGGSVRDIEFADMDNDGDLDFIAPIGGNNVTLFTKANSAVSFTPTILTKHIDGGRVVAAEDIDGDGDKDLVAASYWDDKISWYENLDGQGNYYNTQVLIDYFVNGASSVFVGDVDGDGFKDVLATSYLDNKVIWYKNTDGLGTFAAPVAIDTNLYLASKVYLSDIDNDGDMDVFALGTTRVAWYKNLGSGTFGPQQTIDNISNFTMYRIDFGDLDGDSDLDLSVAGSYGMMRFMNTNGLGTFSARILLETSTYKAYSTKIADLDNDGDNDLIYIGDIGQTSSNSYLGWSKNLNGLGNFGPIQIISTLFAYPKDLIVADFDNDGDKDIASASAGTINPLIAWYENTDGLGAFANTQQIIAQNIFSPNTLVASDINNDGKVDIVAISEEDQLLWYGNTGVQTSNSISGNVRFDLLGDGCTEADALVSGVLLVATDSNGSNATFSQENGQFQIYTTEDGIVTTQVTSQLPTYYAASPASFQSNFTGLGNSDTVNFCIAPIANINDLVVSFYPTINDPRPGFMTGYRIVYKNVGTTQLSGTVSFEFDNTKLNFLDATTAIASQTANTLTFNFTNINPFETRTIDLRFNVFAPPVTNIDEVLLSTATINPIGGDYTPEDNVFQYSQVVIGSYDPNDITCLEGDQVLIADADEYLHYLIRFQNTGTASAINVRVDHTLDSKLDWTTMQLESLSHAGRVAISNGSEVSFIFDNINLPDSTTDEPNSHGFITYKIKPQSNVVLGDVINAVAAIYFDFNPPIITNTASTVFVETLSVVDFEAAKVTVYPNPTQGILTVVSEIPIESIGLYNQLGQLVLTVKDTSVIDVASLRQGVYLMTLKDASGTTWTKKIIKQ